MHLFLQSADLENLMLMRACALVQEGHMTMSRCAEIYDVTVNQIGSVLAWDQVQQLTLEQASLVDQVSPSHVSIDKYASAPKRT